MMRWRVGAFALALGLGLVSAIALPASAQIVCRQVLITTTRTASPIAVTPLDAIAFPVPLTPASSTVVRQIVICRSGTVLPPATRSVPSVIGAPFFGTPMFMTPIVSTPVFESAPFGIDPSTTNLPASAHPETVVGPMPADAVRDLAMRGGEHDRTVVTVTGTVADVKPTSDAHDRVITAFRLEAQGASIAVVVWGRPALRAGEMVRVTGPFYVSSPFTSVTGTPWHDVIAADTLER